MGERLSQGNVAIALLANSAATGAGLFALISTFAGVSGAHFNPVVSLTAAFRGDLGWRDVPAYASAQVVGAFAGVAIAHAMFGEPLVSASTHVRSTSGELLGEVVATFGLLLTIVCTAKKRPDSVAMAVAAYITSAYWFTSSTSFANPAVTLARAASNTFAGIRPMDAPGFILAQVVGTALALGVLRFMIPASEPAQAVPVEPRKRKEAA